MNELIELVYVQGDLLATAVRLFILGFSFDMILSFASLIGESKKSL